LPQVGPLEILVIFIVALVVFGPSKLPQIGRQVGRGIRELRTFQASLRDDIEGAFGDEHDDHSHHEDDEPKRLDASKPQPSRHSEPPPTDTTS